MAHVIETRRADPGQELGGGQGALCEDLPGHVIELKHTAMSREIFAVGSINAAIFMSDQQKPGLYRMSDLL